MKRTVESGAWGVGCGPAVRRGMLALAVAIGFGAGLADVGRAQDAPASKDDNIDALLQKLSGTSGGPEKRASEKSSASKKEAGDKKPEKTPGGEAKKDGKAEAKKSKGSEPLAGKDQEVDELLEKLGETVETPVPDDRRGGGGGGEKDDAGGPSQKKPQKDQDRLTGKDKETDEHLEELTGRKRRKNGDDGERSGAVGELIKEMRDIEQRLAKPDTGESTRQEQKKVVKQIDTMIEQARQSGSSSMRRLVLRRRRQPGQEGGKQQGQTDGALAQGAPPSKPQKPTDRHSKAGGKDIWGHLPPELRAEIENMTNEQPLASKEELIDRYYLSVGKNRPVREESP